MTEEIGPIQKMIIKMGQNKGFVNTTDVSRFYPQSQIELQMNKLIARGYFKNPKDSGTVIIWEYNGQPES